MVAENVADWLLGGAVIDPLIRPVGHSMKLREFIPDKSVKQGKFGGNAYTTDEWFNRYPIWVQDHVWEAAFKPFVDILSRIWACEYRVLPMPMLKRVYEWKLNLDQRRVPHDVPYYMLRTRSIKLEQEAATTCKGSMATDHLAALVPGTYAIFLRTQLLVHVPPPTEFDPFAKAEELDGDRGLAPTWVNFIELTWCLLLVEVKSSSAAGELVMELDADRSLLKKLKSLRVKILRRRPHMCLEKAALSHFF
ncbi:hypothetical protein JCGZ_05234 [Jatropha curcas]|uniref:Aminotransferase-like plant mobile domain-containing protein n=1 Tax=Jatropha curcas TaxID=180498 RepID=A0A067L100_JATCU|nr:hypothetical protein JCGZ_05234 [Jatropha curcas]